MKRQDLDKYKHAQKTEVIAQIAKLNVELHQANLDKVTNQLKNVHKPKFIRRDISQLNSILSQKSA